MGVSNLENYIDKIRNHEGEAEMIDVIKAHNYYSEHQQKESHTPRVMQSLGLQMKISSYSVPTTCFHMYQKINLSEIIIINILKRNKI